jgi:DNA invertase Pin-like site-specific DNA recombinase
MQEGEAIGSCRPARCSSKGDRRSDLYLHQQGVDTSTPAGKALFQMMGVFAEFERAMIQERVHAGLASARAEGKVLGRPTVGDEKEAEIRQALDRGWGLIKTAMHVGVGSVVQRVRAAMQPLAAGR